MNTLCGFKKVQVCGHPRSGTHYITGLIHLNFFNNSGNYIKHYGGHGLGNKKAGQRARHNLDTAYVYIWRNFEDVSKSIFKMRLRFGIPRQITYEEFIAYKYSRMWTKQIGNFVIKVRNLNGNIKYAESVTSMFKNIQLTPKEYWKLHLKSWFELAKEIKNVMIVSYDELKNDFNGTMKELACYLGADKLTFLDIREQIGWIPE